MKKLKIMIYGNNQHEFIVCSLDNITNSYEIKEICYELCKAR